MVHYFSEEIPADSLPSQFNCPFHYTPHPLVEEGARQICSYIEKREEWREELSRGKMFGVLVVKDSKGDIGFLAAFSALLDGKNHHDFFVPSPFDITDTKGYFKCEEREISAITSSICHIENGADYKKSLQSLDFELNRLSAEVSLAKENNKTAKRERALRRKEATTPLEVETLNRESQHEKASFKRLSQRVALDQKNLLDNKKLLNSDIDRLKRERKRRSQALQDWLFEHFTLINGHKERASLATIFSGTPNHTPPSGAGECAAPKLLQYAFLNNLEPIAMGEFWWGESPKEIIRHHKHYYPSCKSRCEPILGFMLQGVDVEPNRQLTRGENIETIPILYRDDHIIVVDKPCGLLSSEGKYGQKCLCDILESMDERLTKSSLFVVHRLDQETSGILIIAKSQEVCTSLQNQFAKREVKKEYVAILNGIISKKSGRISLPLMADISDRPRQMVNSDGKESITIYNFVEEIECEGKRCSRVIFEPLTGRTHQLRVHSAHNLGLNCPILGDTLYGTNAQRLYLCSYKTTFTHPISGKIIKIEIDFPF